MNGYGRMGVWGMYDVIRIHRFSHLQPCSAYGWRAGREMIEFRKEAEGGLDTVKQ